MPDSDYSPYVIAVYAIALVAYGGLAFLWQLALRRAKKRLDEAETL